MTGTPPSARLPANLPSRFRHGGFTTLAMSFYGEPVTVSSTHPELLNQVVIDLRQFIVGGEPLESGPHLRLDFDAALEFGACYLGFWRVMGDALAHRFLLLHGGAVCSPPGATRNDPASSEPAAVLFIGPGGSGKTTLVLAATRLGWEPMGDDVVALEWQTGRLFAVSAPYRVRPDTRLAAHASDDLENTPSTIWDCPPQTDPETAPVLSRIVLLGPDAGAISPAEIGIGVLLGNLRIGDALPRSLVMQRLLHGIRRSKMVRAPNRPPMAATLAPQLAFVQPLLQGLQDHRDGL